MIYGIYDLTPLYPANVEGMAFEPSGVAAVALIQVSAHADGSMLRTRDGLADCYCHQKQQR